MTLNRKFDILQEDKRNIIFFSTLTTEDLQTIEEIMSLLLEGYQNGTCN